MGKAGIGDHGRRDGSRYGGLKQIDPVGPGGQIILDYSVYDAYRAGFERVVFIIRPELEQAFEDAIGRKARRFMQVDYAYQTLDRLPEGLHTPEGREKPLGTAHAVWCAKDLTAGAPIAVITQMIFTVRMRSEDIWLPFRGAG